MMGKPSHITGSQSPQGTKPSHHFMIIPQLNIPPKYYFIPVNLALLAGLVSEKTTYSRSRWGNRSGKAESLHK